ncbi:TPA: plasmid recombination protein [Staphylococcus aureus]|uniref:MobV family relaxase n=1 Tax=Staphylococcus aureus TaxID=1280 RepID=UPI0004B0518B|nr:MobV family relaxase [Staphylococcus aureus]MBB2575099.1 plasmid recombination protein [Staphylococcus aureus]MBB2628688.1 plasmid recombination protein [Staphylococcus aureus]MBB2634065.1 plasmid recombination protein [Staphylococcus aureus]MCJ8078723.1 plasmid recombination protein [Staphylococcus aureus]MDI1515195.1 MobV family relaxase [Staphylococcus aureus]
MSYSIVRVSKVKSGTNTTGIQKHVQRENNNYENEDIDHSKTYLNYDLVNANKQNFNNLIDEKIEQNYTGKRKIRTDAIKHIDGLITSDNDFFDNQTPEDTKQFFEYAKEFLEQEYGKDNLLYATVHMDEKTPHMHYGVVPITDDGRLSAKEVVGNKKALTAFQDRFNEHVKQRGYDLERGQSRQVTNAKHEQISQYKQKTEYHKQEYERESQKTDHIKQKNDKLMQEYQKSLNTLKKPINVPYEQETEKVGGLFSKEIQETEKVGGLFSKEIQETGNVVISQKDFNEFQKQIKAAQDISEDYEYIKSGRALDDKDKEIREKDDLLNKAVERIENADDNFNQLYENAKPLKENIEIALKLLKILLKELERVLGRNTFAERVNKLTEDEPKLNGLAGNLDKKMNPELYSEQEQQQEQQKNQKRDRGMHL